MLAAMFRSTLLIVLLMLSGCHQIEPAPPPLRPRNAQPEVGVQPASSASESKAEHAAAEGAPAGAIVPRVAVEEVEPGQEALAQAILAASKPSMAECRANSGGGMIRLRVVGTKSSAKITIDPGSTVSDKVRVCVLEALSTIDVPDTLSQASPSMRPSAGFTSIISVNW
jgi:DNA-binding protein YbaB